MADGVFKNSPPGNGSTSREIELVRSFLGVHQPKYLKYLDDVKTACKVIEQEFGHSVVVRVYSRSDKQGLHSELKDAEKIYAACARPVSEKNLKAIDDIVGVTVVVFYPDQVGPVLDAIQARLEACGRAKQLEPRKIHRRIYYATHAVMVSRAAGMVDLRCEIQCKTLLHDAWAMKMHDLTYKPEGFLDERMKDLVESVSGTIEGLEQQSEIVRNLIKSRQTIERRPFQASLNAIYNDLMGVLAADWPAGCADPQLAALRSALENEQDYLRSCPRADLRLQELVAAVQGVNCGDQRRVAWLLAVRLAGFRTDADYSSYLQDFIDSVIEAIPEWRNRDFFSDREIATLPLGFYVIQDFTRALEYSDKLLRIADECGLSPFRQMVIQLNKLTWLLERESLHPSKPETRQRLEHSVRSSLDEIGEILDPRLQPSYDDAMGLVEIVFGQTKETVRCGIDACAKALVGGGEDSDVDAAYAEWRTQFGWRRYFDLAEAER